MQVHEIASRSISLHEVPWAYTKFHELACSFMSLHAVSWACMQFLSLSEQFTRISQCLFLLKAFLKKIYCSGIAIASSSCLLSLKYNFKRIFLSFYEAQPPLELSLQSQHHQLPQWLKCVPCWLSHINSSCLGGYHKSNINPLTLGGPTGWRLIGEIMYDSTVTSI